MMTCDRCKRQLEGTIHTRDDYRVDSFRLWTGVTVSVSLKEEGDEEIRFQRIESPRLIILCKHCVSEKKVAQALAKFESPIE